MEPRFVPYVLGSAIKKFYHYQPFNLDHLETLLRDRKLFFSDPAAFNDPWDCKPILGDRRLDGLQEHLAETIRRFRIYCLSVIGDSTLMWAHYGQNHRGICLEFDTNNPLIQKARPCIYRDQYPDWPDLPLDLAQVFLAKAMDWSYEQEFRLFGSEFDHQATKIDGGFVRLPEGTLSAIILGCQCTHHAEIYKLVEQFAPGLPIKQMVRIPHRYKLTIESWQPPQATQQK